MKHRPGSTGVAILIFLSSTVSTVVTAAEINVVNWSDYISPTTVDAFVADTGIAVNYSTLDSDEWLQSRLFGDRSRYDVVYPSSTFMAKQIRAGLYEKLDWSKLPNANALNPALMALVAKQDPGNLYGVPYFWGTDGLLVNTTKVQALLGTQPVPNTWALLLDPNLVKKVSACGVSLPDSASDVFPVVLAYLGKNPNSNEPADYQAAYAHLLKVRPYISTFSSTYTDAMGAGKLCVAFGWSGDVGVVRQQLIEASAADKIAYITPKGQTGVWFTMMGIPKYARNKEAAYKWLNFILRADIAADISNQTTYAMAVDSAKPLIDSSLLNDPAIYPDSTQLASFFVFAPMEQRIASLTSTLWTRLKLAQLPAP